MTLPEVLLWRLLKGQPHGVKFRRQHPSSELGIDVYCLDARLAVEIDGVSHDGGDRPERDLRRDAWLRSQGIDTIRLAAGEILRDPAVAADSIVASALSRLPLHHPALPGGPPPRDKLGEDD